MQTAIIETTDLNSRTKVQGQRVLKITEYLFHCHAFREIYNSLIRLFIDPIKPLCLVGRRVHFRSSITICVATQKVRCTQVQEDRQKTPTTKPSHSQVHNKQKFKLGTIVDTHKINITLQRRHKKIKHSEVDAHKDTSKHQAVNIQLVEDKLQENKSLRRGPAKKCQKTHNRKTNYSEIDAQNYKQTIGTRHTKQKKNLSEVDSHNYKQTSEKQSIQRQKHTSN